MQTVLVSGGSRGIGAAVIRRLCGEGKRACFTYLTSGEAARALAAETGAHAIRCDVSDPLQARSAVERAADIMGSVEGLVLSAGIALKGLFTEISPESWSRLCQVDLSGQIYMAQAALKGMISRKYGAIVFISSVWGSVGASCEAHYSAAKAGLIGLTRALSKEEGPSNIRVNCVCPGVIATDMNADLSAEELAALAEATPLCRTGSAQEVAAAVSFLLSDDASFITGQVLGVDGGFGV